MNPSLSMCMQHRENTSSGNSAEYEAKASEFNEHFWEVLIVVSKSCKDDSMQIIDTFSKQYIISIHWTETRINLLVTGDLFIYYHTYTVIQLTCTLN